MKVKDFSIQNTAKSRVPVYKVTTEAYSLQKYLHFLQTWNNMHTIMLQKI